MNTFDRRVWLRGFSALSLGFVNGCHSKPNPQVHSQKSPLANSPPPSSSASSRIEAIPPQQAPEPKAHGDAAVFQKTESPPLSKIYVQPLGPALPQQDVTFVVAALRVFFPHPVVMSEHLALPQFAYYPPRSRYRAEKLLDYLQSLTAEDAQVVMGLTEVDISTTKGSYEDWGILGLGALGGRQCVISRFRAKRDAQDALHTRIRLAKTVVHEVGHTLGLEHCPNFGCIMEDGKGTVKTTDHEYDLCDSCRQQVGHDVRPRDEGAIPWPRPT